MEEWQHPYRSKSRINVKAIIRSFACLTANNNDNSFHKKPIRFPITITKIVDYPHHSDTRQLPYEHAQYQHATCLQSEHSIQPATCRVGCEVVGSRADSSSYLLKSKSD